NDFPAKRVGRPFPNPFWRSPLNQWHGWLLDRVVPIQFPSILSRGDALSVPGAVGMIAIDANGRRRSGNPCLAARQSGIAFAIRSISAAGSPAGFLNVWPTAKATMIHAHPINSRSGLILDSREVARKLWHMLPGALILGLPLLQDFPLVAFHLPALI